MCIRDSPTCSSCPSQGANNFLGYQPTYWQYMDKLVYWAGSASEGIITVSYPHLTIHTAALAWYLEKPYLIASKLFEAELHQIYTCLLYTSLAGRTCPINEFIHILPVSWLVSQEVVSTLRWARTTCREKNGCITYPVSYTHLDVYKRQLWGLRVWEVPCGNA